MKFKNKITGEVIEFSPTLINSSLLSAQNRQRYYWANWSFNQPEDKGIVLADILEDGEVDRDKSYCIDANYHKGGNPEQYFNKARRQLVFIQQKGRGNNPGGLRALDGKTPSMTACSWQDNNHVTNGITYRKLTPVECERLQTIDDNFTAHVSNTQRYKCLGNGWTVDVIAHIFNHIEAKMVLVEKQLDLFEGAA